MPGASKTGSARPGPACPAPPRLGLLAQGLLDQGCSPRAFSPGAARPGPPRPGLLARGLLTRAARPRPPRPGMLARGLLARCCSPGAFRPRAALPGPPCPGLLDRASSPGAVSYHGSSCLKPLLLPERNGSEYPTLLPAHGVSAVKRTGKFGEVGDTEFQADPPGAMQRTQTQGNICLNPKKATNTSSQLRNSQVRTQRCETQNHKHLQRSPASRP